MRVVRRLASDRESRPIARQRGERVPRRWNIFMQFFRLQVSVSCAILLNFAVLAGRATAEEQEAAGNLNAAHWEKMLPATPQGVGRPIGDRRAWQALADAPAFRSVVPDAEKLLAQPIPEWSDDLYLDFSRTGNRSRGEARLHQRHTRFLRLTLAECLENRGRFLPAIEEAIQAICGDKTWVLPAHDRNLADFHGAETTIDLWSSATAWNLALARYWLGDRLSEKTRALIDGALERRVFTPFVSSITTGKPKLWWLTGTNNWNAVCLSGVCGAALANVESRESRAMFAASAEKYIAHFLCGFTPDGYCSEGLGYWNYGFGHYVMLAETLRQSTGGKVDWMESARIVRIAEFGRRMEILPGVFPAFADCNPKAKPEGRLMAFLSRRYGWGLGDVEARWLGPATGPSSRLFEVGLYAFAGNQAHFSDQKDRKMRQSPLRDWFPDAGVLVCRPAPTERRALGAALKGGHNAEHHNHNDVGTFVVALGQSTPLVDPGSETYTRRTFSPRRYESGVLNSFGHPVPRVAGQLQETGAKAAARVLKTDFTDAADTLVLDLSAA